jgi:hypothetical protein
LPTLSNKVPPTRALGKFPHINGSNGSDDIDEPCRPEEVGPTICFAPSDLSNR